MGCCRSNDNGRASGNSDGDAWLKAEYNIDKTLGKGGSCRVVVAKTKPTGQPQFALKIMTRKEKMNQELFDREVAILKEIDHKNIIKLAKFKKDSLNFYIFTDLCEGGELFDRIVDKHNPITMKMAAKLVHTMLSAIQYCHRQNIVHRDLKPENFVFKDKSPNSDMVLIDFGCAKIVEDDKEYKDLVGTPYYLAPESAAGHKYTRTGKVLKASDVWSIGVIAYVLLTGRPPFNGRSNNEIFSAIIKKKIKFPNGVKLSQSFVDFVKKMLKKSPKQRISVDDALQHNWVTGKEATEQPISGDVIKVLRQFAQQSKLKKAITRTLATHMGKEPEAKISAHFERLDKNNSGGLDVYELSLLLQDMGITKHKAEEEARSIIEATDDDGSGEIEFKEFAQVWQRKLLSVNESYIHAVFSVLDENGDGSIDSKELAKVLDLSDNEKTDDKIAELIREVDSDGDGAISFNEFRTAMLESSAGEALADQKLGHELDEAELRNNAMKEEINLDAAEED